MILIDTLVITLAQIVAVVVAGISMVEISQGTVAVMATLVEIKETEVEVEEGLTPAQMSKGLEWLVRL